MAIIESIYINLDNGRYIIDIRTSDKRYTEAIQLSEGVDKALDIVKRVIPKLIKAQEVANEKRNEQPTAL